MDPNRKIVVIMTDSQRWDMVGCYGNPAMHTPHIDRLAATGLRFERAYTTQPVCGPARSALFTGLYPHTNGSWANCMALGDNVRTIGQRFRDHGIHTAYIGKWHLDGGDYFGLGRCPDGWDPSYWYDMRCYLEELTPEERSWSRHPSAMETGVPEDFPFAHRCSQRAVDFLDRHGGDDFLLVVSYDEPHDPYLCPEPYASMFHDYEFPRNANVADNLAKKPPHQRTWAGTAVTRDPESVRIRNPWFFGANAYVDSQIGRVLEAIERFAPDALVVYTSDHGDFLASHCLSGKGPAAYDEITRIPFLMRWPGVTTPGTVRPGPVSHIDLVPTLMKAAGLPAPQWCEGTPMDLEATEDRNPVFIEFGRYETDHDGFGGFQPMRAVFDGRWKLVVNLLGTDELYDLASDPGEMCNRIEDSGCMCERNRLHDSLLGWMNRTRDPFRGYWWARRPWRDDARPASWDDAGMTRQREHEEYEPRQLDYGTGLAMTEAVRRKG